MNVPESIFKSNFEKTLAPANQCEISSNIGAL